MLPRALGVVMMKSLAAASLAPSAICCREEDLSSNMTPESTTLGSTIQWLTLIGSSAMPWAGPGRVCGAGDFKMIPGTNAR